MRPELIFFDEPTSARDPDPVGDVFGVVELELANPRHERTKAFVSAVR